jgi:hydrogenase maturation protein HypF
VLNSAIKNKQFGVEILVRGTVQGVGFRPFIYKLASGLGITGTVNNSGEGVSINAFSTKETLTDFIRAIDKEAPPLARITAIESNWLNENDFSEVQTKSKFAIEVSNTSTGARTAIPPDIALCTDCEGEISDSRDRRFSYPFTNCTNCGPRFTIVEEIPYDRSKTSMKVFPMCSACEKEYHDPADRRFHAQPNACPECGPQVSFHDAAGTDLLENDPLQTTAHTLIKDKVVAIKGLGGFHLSVNALSENAVALLRERKGRPDKPLAIMVGTIEAVEKFCHVSGDEKKTILSPEHPIVILKKKMEDSELAANLAPGIDEIGVMLPYTPLHLQLFKELGDIPLVMTSGNISGTPICIDNDDAIEKLGTIADNFLLHNRDIVTRVDDSVVKKCAGIPLLLRRSRGYVPASIEVGHNLPEILACGAGLKNTFSLGREQSVIASQHIGDLDNLETYEFFLESMEHLKTVYQIEPEAVACDLHPDYQASRYATELGLPLYRIQHHHAHAVAVMAEHNLDSPVLAVILDGTGLGDDGTIWGGEILRTGLTDYERLAHLEHLHLPGGDAAATEPWRMGISALYAAYGEEGIAFKNLPQSLQSIDEAKLIVLSSMLTTGFNSPLSSSCGRLFDAVAALLGIKKTISYEGQAAMELEAVAQRAKGRDWQVSISKAVSRTGEPSVRGHKKQLQIQTSVLIKEVIHGIQKGRRIEEIALQFHSALIADIVKLVHHLAEETKIHKVILSGGCMQNSLLLEGFFHAFKEVDIQCFTGNALPINDGAISVGQTIIGGLRHVSRNPNESNSSSGRS